jgi:LacI family transcriptional regulator
MKVTIKDIAKLVGVASQNVSGVLNENPRCRVSPATREKILTTARDLGYCKNISAKILRGEDTYTVAILVANRVTRIADEHLLRMVMQLINRFNGEQYACFLTEAWDPVKDNLAIVKDLMSRGARRFVIIGDIPSMPELEELFATADCSFIQYGRHGRRHGDFSMAAAVHELWDSLSPRQHSHFKFITNPDISPNNRITAFQSLSKDWTSFLFKSNLVFMDSGNKDELYMECGYSDTKALLKRFPETQVILYHSDYYLQGGIRYCVEHGLRIGQDIQLVGINYSSMVRFSPFPLWSLSYPEEEFVDFLFSEVHKKEPVNRIFEMKLNKNSAMDRLQKKPKGAEK